MIYAGRPSWDMVGRKSMRNDPQGSQQTPLKSSQRTVRPKGLHYRGAERLLKTDSQTTVIFVYTYMSMRDILLAKQCAQRPRDRGVPGHPGFSQ